MFTPIEMEYLECALRDDIQGFYDEPGNVPLIAREIVETQRSICQKLGFEYDNIVLEETTNYERERVQCLVK